MGAGPVRCWHAPAGLNKLREGRVPAGRGSAPSQRAAGFRPPPPQFPLLANSSPLGTHPHPSPRHLGDAPCAEEPPDFMAEQNKAQQGAEEGDCGGRGARGGGEGRAARTGMAGCCARGRWGRGNKAAAQDQTPGPSLPSRTWPVPWRGPRRACCAAAMPTHQLRHGSSCALEPSLPGQRSQRRSAWQASLELAACHSSAPSARASCAALRPRRCRPRPSRPTPALLRQFKMLCSRRCSARRGGKTGSPNSGGSGGRAGDKMAWQEFCVI
jgi:hypothetical protein